VELAALTSIAISQAQSFADGNKRTAEAALHIFLRLNGYRFTGNWMQVALFLEINAFLSEVPNRGDEPREKGMQAFALWLDTAIVARD
jgi:prophage maintenance system killer protein